MKTSQIFGVYGFSLFLVVIAIAETGCVKASVTPPAVGVLKDPTDGPKPLGDLTGTWETGCTMDAVVQDGHGASVLEISNESYKLTTNIYLDDTCSSSMMSVTEEGTIKNLGASTALSGAYDIEFTIQKSSHAPNEEPHSEYGLMLIENGAMYFSSFRSLTSESRPSEVSRKYSFKKK
jgi:hypothetical protein